MDWSGASAIGDLTKLVAVELLFRPLEFVGIRPISGERMHAFDENSLIVEKTELMTSDEYEGLLRPAFQQAKWRIVTVAPSSAS